jgi:hypothetical protein
LPHTIDQLIVVYVALIRLPTAVKRHSLTHSLSYHPKNHNTLQRLPKNDRQKKPPNACAVEGKKPSRVL